MLKEQESIQPGQEVLSPRLKKSESVSWSEHLYFPFLVPADAVLCAKKVTALSERGKGRDFYDVMYLLGLMKILKNDKH